MSKIYERDIDLLKRSLIIAFNCSAEEDAQLVVKAIQELQGIESATFQNTVTKEFGLELVPVFDSCLVVASEGQQIAALTNSIEGFSGVRRVDPCWPGQQ